MSEFRHDAADERPAASMPFQIDRTMRGFAVNLGPAMWSARAHMFGGNQMETLELDIVHDLLAQRSASARDNLNHRLHSVVRFDGYVDFATPVSDCRVEAIDPFDCAANELHAFAGERGVRVVPTRVPPTEANNAQRSTLNVSMEAAPFEVLKVGR